MKKEDFINKVRGGILSLVKRNQENLYTQKKAASCL